MADGMADGKAKRTNPTGRRLPPRRAARVTLKDVAAAAGVSVPTVSYVVNNTGAISEAVRLRVREVVDRLGYVPNTSAQAMRTGRSKTIGLVISDIRRPFFPEFAHELQLAARNVGYSILTFETDGSETAAAKSISTLRSLGVDGIIATELLPDLFALRIPTIMVAETTRALDSITGDDFAGGALVADHLMQLGHRRIAMVSSPKEGGVQSRRKGVLSRLGSTAELAWEVTTPPSDAITQDVRDRLRKADATAVICSHDEIAIGVMRALRELGRSVPGDVSVVGFDDVQWAAIATPSLTTIRQPFREMAVQSMTMLLERMEKPRRKARRVTLPVELVQRESAGPAPR